METEEMKLSILNITGRADHGGGPKHLDVLINYFSENKYILSVACPKDKPYFDKWINNKKVSHIINIPHRRITIRAIVSMLLFIKRNKVDIVHSHGPSAGIYSLIFKILYPKLKVVHTFHGITLDGYSKFRRTTFLLIEQLLIKFSDKIINVSQSEQQLSKKNGLFHPNKSFVILNGIPKLIKPDTITIDEISKDKFIITTITRYDYQKNMTLAYEIANLFRNDNRFLFLWIGDGEERNLFEKKILENKCTNIKIIGFSEKIVEYLSITNLYFSSSYWEGLPLSLLEASSLGIPLIASNVVGNRDVVLHGQNGFLYDINKPIEARDFIINLFSDKILYEKCSTGAFNIFKDKFIVDKMISEYDRVYNSLSGNSIAL
jgi:glycosyltransferase involved in cell wall biosynthesis